MGDTITRYHVALDVARPARVCSSGVAGAFADEGVSIKTVRQEGRGDAATLVLVTHAATDAALARTVEKLAGMALVGRAASVMRVEGIAGE